MRVASYNTRDLRDDGAAAAGVVRAIGPDVLCLQEVPRRLFAERRVAAFARSCGMTWSGGHRGSGGTTVFTAPRVEVHEQLHRRLPVRFPDRTRGYAVATVVAPGHQPMTVVSVHLSLQPEERLRHAAIVLDAVAAADRLVVCGDLNEDASGAAFSVLASRLRVVSTPEATFPARAPRHRLDVILATPDVDVAPHAELDLPVGLMAAASDHRPVWVDVLA